MKTSDYSGEAGRILTIDKPVDWTSFDVVNKIRRLTGIKKVGHAGTLDPFATGVLLVCLGRATKKSSELMQMQKEYRASIALGSETDTMDHTGKVVVESDVPKLEKGQIETAIEAFVGEIEQEIPAYSAAKFKGKRLYRLAREGKEVPTLHKKVTIHDIELLAFNERHIEIRVVCGRGTYIRTLGRDIARALDTAGHLDKLVRTRVGSFKIEDALTIDEFQQELKGMEVSGK